MEKLKGVKENFKGVKKLSLKKCKSTEAGDRAERTSQML
jgi:hypothetical protein